MAKKILKWTGISLLVIIVLLIAAPFLFKDKIKSMVVKAINDQVDATVSFEDVSLSFISNFPQASVTVDKLSVINKAPFAGDTLVYVGELNLKMSVNELFKGDGEPMDLKSFSVKNSVINILFNKDGIGNFDIARKKAEEEQPATEEPSKPFALKIDEYAIENLRFRFFDERSKMNVVIDSLNHNGTGNFAANKLDLDTHTDLNLTVDMDKTNFMRNTKLKLDAVIGMDMDKSIYTFKENKLLVNQMGLEFDGSVALLENGQDINLTFKTPESSFKNFLALIPEAYSSSLANVKTEGNFTVNGKINGVMDDNHIPKFNVAFLSKNASFKYPDLPKSITNINIDTKVVNETGTMNDTYVNIDEFSFRIDQDVFSAKANIRNIVENALVDAKLKGTVNLGNVTKAYPVKLDTPLSGILKADVETKFDMASVEKGAYENIDNRGNISLSGFNYTMDGFKNPFIISLADMSFNPGRVSLNRFDAKTGSSDLSVSGTLDNFYGFVFKNKTLKGNFAMKSNKLVINDFMSNETAAAAPAKTEGDAEGEKKAATKTTSSDAVKIPAFLDCTITANANSVVYDNLTLKDFGGKMVIKDEAVAIQNAKTSIFGGNIGFAGDVSTKQATPTFNMDLGLNSLDITQAFTQLDMLKKIAPIAEVITGKLTAGVKVGGNLDSKEMTPDTNSISGNLGGNIANAVIHTDKSKVLQSLTSNVKFLDPSKLNLNQKINLTFSNGKVIIQPFVVKYQNMDINVSGEHGFDQNMSYKASFDLPAKYLGDDIVNKAAALKVDISKITVPVNVNITGTFQKPKVGTDLAAATKSVATQLVNQQKDKYVNEAKEKATEKGKELIGNLISGNKSGTTTKDTTKTTTTSNQNVQQKAEEAAKTKGKDLINGLFKKKDKKESN
ncbi:AsmA-like C-terminal region-containing protein [Flavobacterium sp. RHBU_3]|uniref:AsmA-like C-terminal region-containing protein n=1 Tax=Flavobacterium sp. RHBU_3 TaxID=3391184 RepID=UPI003984E4E3